MGATKVQTLIDEVLEILEDVSGVYYTVESVGEMVHEAEVAVGTVRPDALSYETDFRMDAGTRQALPDDGLRLRDVLYNRGVHSSEVDGQPIRLIARGTLDDVAPGWREQTGIIVHEYMYDERHPKQFDVYPGMADGDRSIRIDYERNPPAYDFTGGALTNPDLTIFVPDEHRPALVEWALYRLLSRQNDVTQSSVDGSVHYTRFLELLGVSLSTDANASLKNRFQLD